MSPGNHESFLIQVLQQSGLFDEDYYLHNSPDVAADGVAPLRHFLNHGCDEGRRPNPLFDPAYYLETYPDVVAAGVNPLVHYIKTGANEGRNPSAGFNTRFYLYAYPDVAAAKVNPLEHYLRFGASEGRLPVPPRRNEKPAKTATPSSSDSEQLEVLRQSGLFDEDYYLHNHPDVAADGVSPLEHFFNHGCLEGRRPNPLFDPAYYLETYPDVVATGVNPLVHYIRTGAKEGRNPSAEFNTTFYLEAYPDVAAAEVNPLEHYLRYGREDERSPAPGNTMCQDRIAQSIQKRFLVAAQCQLPFRPLVSILLPTHNAEPSCLVSAVCSVLQQAYPLWELQISDDGSTDTATLAILNEIDSWDSRIRVVRNSKNRGGAHAMNDALREARGEFVAMLDQEAKLTCDALFEIVLSLNKYADTDVVYTDQDFISPQGDSVGHLYKPDWSPELFRGVMYVGQLLTVRRSLALEVGGFDPAYDRVEDFEFMLRLSERTRNIRHVPKILYHSRQAPASVAEAGKAIELLQVAAVQSHLRRLSLSGIASPHPSLAHRVVIKPERKPKEKHVSAIVVAHSNAAENIAKVRRSLERSGQPLRELWVPSDWSAHDVRATSCPTIKHLPARLERSQVTGLQKVVSESRSDFILIMSAGLEIETDDWLEHLLLPMQQPDVAFTCPLIVTTDGLVASAGLVVREDGKLCPAMPHLNPDDDGYAGSLSCSREISVAGGGELILIRRKAIAEFDSSRSVFATVDFYIADLTLRATNGGQRTICVPHVRARRAPAHEPSADWCLDELLFRDLWGGELKEGDRYYNVNFINTVIDYRRE